MNPTVDLGRFYEIIGHLESSLGGKTPLGACTSATGLPPRGVYLLFEPGEYRGTAPAQLRVVRVGTHGLTGTSKATLWSRLRAHKGTAAGGGNHRGSVLRRHVGAALIGRDGAPGAYPQWGLGASAPAAVRASEGPWEQVVSEYVGQMGLLWVAIDDEPGPHSQRGYIERNSIALLSQVGNTVDPASAGWLGHHSTAPAICESGLWNVNHVGEAYDPGFLDALRAHVDAMLT